MVLQMSLIGITSIGFAACASGTGDSRTSRTAEPVLVCVSERQTGTHFSQRVCRTRSQIEAEQAAARETMQDIRDHQPAPVDSSR